MAQASNRTLLKEEKAMKKEDKKLNTKEEAKKEAKAEENGVQLTDEQLRQVVSGTGIRYDVLGEIVKRPEGK